MHTSYKILNCISTHSKFKILNFLQSSFIKFFFKNAHQVSYNSTVKKRHGGDVSRLKQYSPLNFSIY